MQTKETDLAWISLKFTIGTIGYNRDKRQTQDSCKTDSTFSKDFLVSSGLKMSFRSRPANGWVHWWVMTWVTCIWFLPSLVCQSIQHPQSLHTLSPTYPEPWKIKPSVLKFRRYDWLAPRVLLNRSISETHSRIGMGHLAVSTIDGYQ